MSGGNIEILAPAKINLHLAIKKKRQDGYHELETVMQKIDLVDRLTLTKVNSGISLRCAQGNSLAAKKNIVPENEANLAHRAAAAFFAEAGSEDGVAITLEKNIPVAAGLGGGSSDAGAVLSGLNDLFPGRVSFKKLLELGGNLGADVPFFVEKAPAVFAGGIGDVLHPIRPLDRCRILLVNPGFPVSTKWVYDNFALTSGDNTYTLGPGFGPNKKAGWFSRTASDLERYSVKLLYNDLEWVTQGKYQEISECKQQLMEDGADMALMSGSGPTVFGIFGDSQKAQESYDKFKKLFADVFICQPIASDIY